MHRQIWRAAVPLLLLAAVCGALWPLRRFLTAEAISRASPEQLWLAAGFLLLLYGVKSVSFCFPMSALTAAGGLLFPYPAALAVNLTGTAVAQTLPFLMGRWNRQWAAGVLSRFPKAGRFLSQEQGREGLLVFLLRLAGASPGDLVSLALGAAGIPPSRYLVPGVLGAAPRVAAATLLGAALWDPWSRRFWISVGINAAITYISTHLDEVSLQGAADAAAMSVSTFSRFFKRVAGIGFADFVRRLRVGRACRLLTCTNMPIAKIQQLSGYTNASNFNRRFLEETGMTPSQYRREH